MKEWLVKQTSKGRGIITGLKRTQDIKGKKKEFTTKEHRYKNIIIIKTKITINFKCLDHYIE